MREKTVDDESSTAAKSFCKMVSMMFLEVSYPVFGRSEELPVIPDIKMNKETISDS
ncbi:MAG: hypothetical protein ACLUAO_04350 [Streptococcus sp.]